TRVVPGDKVIMHWRKGEGIESPFPSYIYDNKKITSGKVTTLSEYSIVSENRLTVVPANTPDELCALLGCGLSTALGIINYDADIKFGESVLILGCGGVGLNLITGANVVGAGSIYGIDLSTDKRATVTELGATFITSVEDITESIDCIIDTTGNLDLVSNFLPKLSSRGRCIIVSQPHTFNTLKIKQPAVFFSGQGQIIRATQGGRVNPTDDFPRYIKLYNKGMLNLSKLITHRLPLSEINTAVDLMKSGQSGRILLYP
ncbi:hypothetical protein EBU95_21760, partial [bacterium]|nr:hypothetical protein [bacterium]